MLTERLVNEPNGRVRYKVLQALGRLVAQHDVAVDVQVMEEQLRSNLVEQLRLLALWQPLDASGEIPDRARASGRLVMALLDEKMAQARERVFRLFQILHKNEDIRGVALALEAKNPRRRANALEFLDLLALGCSQATRDLLHITTDDLSATQRLARAREHLGPAPRGAHGALRALMDDEDDALAALSAYHSLMLGVDALRTEARALFSRRPELSFIADVVPESAGDVTGGLADAG